MYYVNTKRHAIPTAAREDAIYECYQAINAICFSRRWCMYGISGVYEEVRQPRSQGSLLPMGADRENPGNEVGN